MIVLDTHVWLWWVHGSDRLPAKSQQRLRESEAEGLGVSLISCWEIAKLIEYDRIELPNPLEEWLEQALTYPGVVLLDLTIPIVLEATRLPGEFHRDPADQLIVATARVHEATLATADRKILGYPNVETLRCR